MTESRGVGAWSEPLVNPEMPIDPSVRLSPFSVIGSPTSDSPPGRIEAGCSIGSFCHIALSAILRENVEIDHYVRVGDRTSIGPSTKVLYNARVFSDVVIGANCIISGDVANAVRIGDNVIYMGDIAHSHRNADIPWDEYVEPSPVIHDCSVVGLRALIIGPVSIGPRSYVGAGEVVRHDVPPESVYAKGRLSSLSSWKGLITVPEPGAR